VSGFAKVCRQSSNELSTQSVTLIGDEEIDGIQFTAKRRHPIAVARGAANDEADDTSIRLGDMNKLSLFLGGRSRIRQHAAPALLT
jgi:hypothetical protein